MESQLFEIDRKQLSRFRKMVIVGDLHGDYKTLCSLLEVVDVNKDAIIFLGDYADRGLFGVEVIRTVSSLVKNNGRNVLPLKGNHEDFTVKGNPNFSPCNLSDEARKKIGNWQQYFENEFRPFVKRLHLAAIIPNELLFLHGGVSSKIRTLDDLRYPNKSIETDVLWSDPFEGKGEHPNKKRGGIGVEFGDDITMGICKNLGIKRIIRSHEPNKAMSEPCYSHNGKVITVSSTTAYGGTPFVLCINPSDTEQTRSLRIV